MKLKLNDRFCAEQLSVTGGEALVHVHVHVVPLKAGGIGLGVAPEEHSSAVGGGVLYDPPFAAPQNTPLPGGVGGQGGVTI